MHVSARSISLVRVSSFFLTTVLLAACSNDVVVSSHRVDQSYDSLQIGFATRRGEQMPVVVMGDPFNGPAEPLNAAILDAMNGSAFGVSVDFAVDPQNPATQNSRVVMAFNPQGNAAPGTLCTEPPRTGTTQDNELRVSAAYCEGSLPLTEANARVGDAAGPESPKFRSMMSQLTQALFPPFNPNFGDGSDDCDTC